MQIELPQVALPPVTLAAAEIAAAHRREGTAVVDHESVWLRRSVVAKSVQGWPQREQQRVLRDPSFWLGATNGSSLDLSCILAADSQTSPATTVYVVPFHRSSEAFLDLAAVTSALANDVVNFVGSVDSTAMADYRALGNEALPYGNRELEDEVIRAIQDEYDAEVVRVALLLWTNSDWFVYATRPMPGEMRDRGVIAGSKLNQAKSLLDAIRSRVSIQPGSEVVPESDSAALPSSLRAAVDALLRGPRVEAALNHLAQFSKETAKNRTAGSVSTTEHREAALQLLFTLSK
jgi:hypothetical protein